MSYYSAQIYENEYVKAITETPKKLEGANIKHIDNYDESLLGKKYDGDNQNGKPILMIRRHSRWKHP